VNNYILNKAVAHFFYGSMFTESSQFQIDFQNQIKVNKERNFKQELILSGAHNTFRENAANIEGLGLFLTQFLL
jgi:hypothetical protein